MSHPMPQITGPVVLAARTDGVAVVGRPAALTRLHFFDGRLLSGADLNLNEDGIRALDLLVAQAGGQGVVWGFDVSRSGETLAVSAGLAFDPVGRPLRLPEAVVLSVADLLAATGEGPAPAPAPAKHPLYLGGGRTSGAFASVDTDARASFAPCVIGHPTDEVEPVAGTSVYVLTAGWVEGYCGTMDIYGAPCEPACTGGTDRPYRVDGVVFRLRPLRLRAPLAVSKAVLLTAEHLRSQLASAYFADERAAAGPEISAAVLAGSSWCLGTAGPSGSEIPLALVVRSGQTTAFHDEWAARRERVEPPPRVGFDGRLAMRPRAVFAAQIAQFQCQLADRLSHGGLPGGPRRLVDGGFVELPPGGYLAIDRTTDLVVQVGKLFGPGVDLRFISVPEDQVPHEIESVAHRDRIGLLAGLEDPKAKPAVDVLVPGGTPVAAPTTAKALALSGSLGGARAVRVGAESAVELTGVARLTRRGTGFTIDAAGTAAVSTNTGAVAFVGGLADKLTADDPRTVTVPIPPPSSRPLAFDTLVAHGITAGQVAEALRGGEASARMRRLAFGRGEARPLAFRASVTTEKNLWQLGPDETALLEAQLDVYAPSGGTSSAVDLFGQVSVETSTDDSRALRFTGFLAVTRDAGAVKPRSVQQTVTAELRVDPDTGVLAFQFHGPFGGDAPGRLDLGGDPFRIAGQAGPLQVDLREDTAVQDENAPAHRAAAAALRLLQVARPQEVDYVKRYGSRIFGTPKRGALTLSSTRDWVAFRRRPAEPPAPAPTPAMVQVWVHASTEKDAHLAREQLMIGAGDALLWKQVRTVSFDPDTGALRDPNLLRPDYDASGAQPGLEFVGFAPTSMPSGKDRCAAIVKALGFAARPGGPVPIEAVPKPPAGFVDPDTDGNVFLIAFAAPGTEPPTKTGMQVVAIRQDTEKEAVAAFTAKPPNVDALRAAVDKGGATLFGTVIVSTSATDAEAAKSLADVTAMAAAKLAAMELTIDDPTPVLWLDENWTSGNSALADSVVGAAKQVSEKVAPGRGLVDQLVLDLGTDPTPAMLIVVYHPRHS